MPRYVVFLRGINLGGKRRVGMADLRAALESEGFEDVRTLLQSGNVVLTSGAKPRPLERELAKALRRAFGFDIAVVARTRDELADVIRADPFGGGSRRPRPLSGHLSVGQAEPQGGAGARGGGHGSRTRRCAGTRGVRVASGRGRPLRAGEADHRQAAGGGGDRPQLADHHEATRAGRLARGRLTTSPARRPSAARGRLDTSCPPTAPPISRPPIPTRSRGRSSPSASSGRTARPTSCSNGCGANVRSTGRSGSPSIPARPGTGR